jgi:hypothetical protein
VGPHQGRKVFTLQTIPASVDDFTNSQVGKIAGFSLHAGVATEARQRKKLERLCRYISTSEELMLPVLKRYWSFYDGISLFRQAHFWVVEYLQT